jgi:hypothetical protein
MKIRDILTEQGVAEEGYGTHPSQRVDPRTGKRYVPPKSPLGKGVAEGSEQVYKVIAVDKSNALGRRVKLNVKANSVDEVFERLAMSDWYPLSINGAEVIDGRR